ncbi:hypothetical protein F5Y17DRAFT_433057 [Xylariaceae sp. FL0594]|nr:hypothetical protein F5Y17DRAFT_433057 [Xylariaceae sp. FL0594]
MPTPFICRKCTARLFTSASRGTRLQRRLLHSDVAQTGLVRDWHHSVSEPEHLRTPVAPQATRPIPQTNANPSIFPISETRPLRNEVPRRSGPQELYDTLKRIAEDAEPTSAIRHLFDTNTRIGSRSISGEDNPFIGLFDLSPQQALRAVDQLNRLLQSHADHETIVARLDDYVAWKTRFSTSLKKPIVSRAAAKGTLKTDIGAADHEAVDTTKVEAMRIAWERLDEEDRQYLWPQFMNNVLEGKPHLLPTFIETTFDPSWCPSYIVEDLLSLLFQQYSSTVRDVHGDADGDPVLKTQIRTIATHVLNNSPPGYLVLQQAVLGFLFSEVPTSELTELLERLETIQHPLLPPTLLHAASQFAKDNATKHRAKDILDSLTKTPLININTPAASSVCTSLLNLKDDGTFPDERAAPDILFKFLLDRGWRPNLLGLTALIQNFCVRRHMEPAWKIFDFMVHLGIRPDPYLCSILIKASKKQNMDGIADGTALGRILGTVRSGGGWSVISYNHFLSFLAWTEEHKARMHGPFRRIPRRPRKRAHDAMNLILRCYSFFFDLAPLQKFVGFDLQQAIRNRQPDGPVIAEIADQATARPGEKTLAQPDSNTLYIMLDSIIRHMTKPELIVRYYRRFLKLVADRDPTALALLEDCGTGIYDIWIRHLMQFRMLAGFAVRLVIKLIEDAKREQAQLGGVNRYHPFPSVHTWVALLKGLRNHRHLDGVISVFDMMGTIGSTQPNLAAWNVLIDTLAMEKNVTGAVRALRALEAAGLQPNESTTRAFQSFPRPMSEKAIALIEKLRSKDPELTSTFGEKPAALVKFSAGHAAHRIGRNPYNAGLTPFPLTLEELASQLESERWVGAKQKYVVNQQTPFRTVVSKTLTEKHLGRARSERLLSLSSST